MVVSDPALRHAVVLVVEGDVLILMVATALLVEAGYRVAEE